jgi:hypothetical protein
MPQQLGATQPQHDLQQIPPQYRHLQHLLPPVPAHMLTSQYNDQLIQSHYELHAQAFRLPEAYAQEKALDAFIELSRKGQGSLEQLQQLLGPGVQQHLQQQQQQKRQQQQQQQQLQEASAPAAELPAEELPAEAPEAAAGSAHDVPAGDSSGSPRKGSTLQQLLAMVLGGTQLSSGAGESVPSLPHSQQQQQQQHGVPGRPDVEVRLT